MSKKTNGFTLVELSIVMIIIGLLIGGVLKGWELVDNARTKRLIAEIKSIYAANQVFQDSYNSLPGDMANATSLLPGCNTGVYCADGDGNRYIGSDGTDQYTNSSAIINHAPEYMETVQFWKHLALADLISGLNAAANTATPEYGYTHPALPWGGGLEMYFDANIYQSLPGARVGGHVIRTSSESSMNGQPLTRVLSPTQAFKIDKLLDDGRPNSGEVIANYGYYVGDCKVNNTGGSLTEVEYDIKDSRTVCTIYYRMW